MTNLNAVLQVYFVDADIDDVVNTAYGLNSSKKSPKVSISDGMDEKSFQKYFIRHNTMYGTDVVGNIRQLASKHWLSLNGSRKPNILNILAFATDKMLRWNKDEPVCEYNDYLRWNDISAIVGEEILTAAYLAIQSARDGLDIKSFAWKPCVTTNNFELERVLKRGLGELHYHMQGSSLIFDVSWMSLMNSDEIKSDIRAELNKLDRELYPWIEKARAARVFLFKSLKCGNIDCSKYALLKKLLKASPSFTPYCASYVKNEISGEKIYAKKFGEVCLDYAIRDPITERDKERYYNVALIGERKLIYECLKEIYNGNEALAECAVPLYVYFLVKNKFRKYIVQNDQIKGFSHFQDIQGRKGKFINKKSYGKLFEFMALHATACNQAIEKLEMRIAPKATASKLIRDLKLHNDSANDAKLRLNQENKVEEKNVKAGYIIHFIKRDEKKDGAKYDDLFCRSHKYRDSLNSQANAIAYLVRYNSVYVKGGFKHYLYKKQKDGPIYPIIGIDAASSEFGCRPEVFASVFRRLKYVSRRNEMDSLYKKTDYQLGRTFHVGEDFYDVVDGLRAIDECIFFLNFASGDRIGHAVALGIDANDYYKTRNFNIVLPRQILLDNAVWLLKKMEEYSIDDQYGTKYRLKEIFETHFRIIYDIEASIEDYYASWMLRGDEPSLIKNNRDVDWKPYARNKVKPILEQIRKNEKATDLYQKYHYSKKVREMGDEIVEYQLEDGDALVISEVQEKMRQRIAREKIAIETNPTSNMRITDIDRYSKHPVTTFYSRGLKPDCGPDQITVSINTDDQGVFATSLEKEYTLIACALEKKRNDDGTPAYSSKDIYDWLDDIRESSLTSSFLEDDIS